MQQLLLEIINLIFRIIDFFTGIFYFLIQVKPTTNEKARALVLTCVDHRFLDNYIPLMDKINLDKKYDQFILAGASLSFTNDAPPKHLDKDFDLVTFKKAYVDHLQLLLQLRTIDTIIVVDHADCGAYKLYYDGPDPKELHVKNIKTFLKKIRKLLQVEQPDNHYKFVGYYVNLEGNPEKVANY